ncbi:MAG TPA: SIS domain-containing protein [Alphaproteobacteria bacterium]|jgi:D-sedoheptulose 7-phosphate isomerase
MSSLHDYLAGTAELLQRMPGAGLDKPVADAVAALNAALAARKPVLICGNGGSAADAQHIAAELVGRYERERVALPVMALAGDAATLTALGNDYGYERLFSRQVEAHGQPGGVLVGLSTSGKSPNVLKAVEAAKARGMTTIALTGEGGGPIGALADILIAVPSRVTARVQEMHICLYHYICGQVEAAAADK